LRLGYLVWHLFGLFWGY